MYTKWNDIVHDLNIKTFRQNIVNELNTIIGDENKSQNVEISIFNYTIKESTDREIIKKWENKRFMLIYKERLRSIWINLLNKNTKLLEKILSGDFDATKIGSLTHQEIDPDKWNALIEKKIERDNNTFNANDKEGASNEFYCVKCHKRETKYCQVQTRSADEPMTTFVTCVNCGNHWKC
jgi:transcription elongation factor S-II